MTLKSDSVGTADGTADRGMKEIRGATEKLVEGGKVLMPLGDYGFDGVKQFAWVQDKYGVSWQLSLE